MIFQVVFYYLIYMYVLKTVKPGSHLRHNDITGRSRKRKKCLVLMFYVSSVNNIS